MVMNTGFHGAKRERKKLSFFKIFQSADLSSEIMRAIPYNFMRRVSEKDFSNKMVIRAQWGSTWNLEINKNPRFYYMEKPGWDKFVSDNALGENEFITFTLNGNSCVTVNIYEQTGKEMLKPRKSPTMPPSSSKRVKTGQGERKYKDVKKEEETGECSGAAELKSRKKKAEESNSKLTKKKTKTNHVDENTIPEFTMILKKSYLRFLAIPKQFADNHICNSTTFKIHHANGIGKWKVLCLVRKTGTTFSSGWSKLARDYPLSLGDTFTLKLIKPNEFLLSVKPQEKITMAKEEITIID